VNDRRRIAVLTGTRAEFGLLRTVMRHIRAHRRLELITIVTGTHLLGRVRTIDEVGADLSLEMQREGDIGRLADAAAVARGVAALAEHLPQLNPDVVLLLGDRIEPFAAAAACAVAGIRIAHMHGGDRAEGVADESLRHAITKLAHIHLPATQQSAQRIERMGEDPQRIHVVGSPAVDELHETPTLDDATFRQLGSPDMLVLMHPTGRSDEAEADGMQRILQCCTEAGSTLVLEPNHDAGRAGIMQAIAASGCPSRSHLPRQQFIGLLRRVHMLVGNSSAGLIEAAVLGIPAVNIGTRQAGRERPDTVIDVPELSEAALRRSIATARNRLNAETPPHPYGDGRTGLRTAELLATLEPGMHPIIKRNAY